MARHRDEISRRWRIATSISAAPQASQRATAYQAPRRQRVSAHRAQRACSGGMYCARHNGCGGISAALQHRVRARAAAAAVNSA